MYKEAKKLKPKFYLENKNKNLRQRDKHGFKNYTGGKTVLASDSQFNLVFGRFLPFLPNRTDTRLN